MAGARCPKKPVAVSESLEASVNGSLDLARWGSSSVLGNKTAGFKPHVDPTIRFSPALSQQRGTHIMPSVSKRTTAATSSTRVFTCQSSQTALKQNTRIESTELSMESGRW